MTAVPLAAAVRLPELLLEHAAEHTWPLLVPAREEKLLLLQLLLLLLQWHLPQLRC